MIYRNINHLSLFSRLFPESEKIKIKNEEENCLEIFEIMERSNNFK